MKPCIECRTPQSTAHVICPDCLKRLKSESSNWEAAALLDASAKKLEEVTRELARTRDAFRLAVRSVYTMAAYIDARRDTLDLPEHLTDSCVDEVERMNRIVAYFGDIADQAE